MRKREECISSVLSQSAVHRARFCHFDKAPFGHFLICCVKTISFTVLTSEHVHITYRRIQTKLHIGFCGCLNEYISIVLLRMRARKHQASTVIIMAGLRICDYPPTNCWNSSRIPRLFIICSQAQFIWHHPSSSNLTQFSPVTRLSLLIDSRGTQLLNFPGRNKWPPRSFLGRFLYFFKTLGRSRGYPCPPSLERILPDLKS